jgi:Holliday junction resolvase RusA-like endonuclease
MLLTNGGFYIILLLFGITMIAVPSPSKVYTLLGDPIPLSRPRRGMTKLYDAQKQLKFAVGLQLAHQHGDLPKYQGPLALYVKFYFALASSWSKQKSRERLGAPHLSPPDLDNCIKFLSDVAQGVLYDNDCIISQIHALKLYDNIARVEFYIERLV